MSPTPFALSAMLLALAPGCSSEAAPPPESAADAGSEVQDVPDVVQGELPCGVSQVLQARCQECHGSPPVHGAPFPLVTYGDTQADYFGTPVWVRMRNAVDAGFMPPIPKAPLSDADKATMLEWLDQGAPPAQPGEACP